MRLVRRVGDHSCLQWPKITGLIKQGAWTQHHSESGLVFQLFQMYWVAGLPESLECLLVATLVIHLAWGNKLLMNSALTVKKILKLGITWMLTNFMWSFPNLNWEKHLAFCSPYGIFIRSILNILRVSSALFPSLKHNLIQMFVLDRHIFVWITGAEGVLEIARFVMFGSAFAHKHFSKVPSKLSLIVWWTETKHFGLLALFYRFPFMGLKIPGNF
jgi:hypothetical protein